MRAFATLTCLLLTGLAPCVAQTTANDCARLKESIPAASTGLPSGGATIDSAELILATPLAAAQLPLPPYLAVVPAAPEYCKALGAIAPVDPKAPAIRF